MPPDSLLAYDYELPRELIAQEPPPCRGDSRLLVLDRRTRARIHGSFREIESYVRPGDVFILNDTRVFPARLRARRATGARVEVFLLETLEGGFEWSALCRPARVVRPEEPLFVEGTEPGGPTIHAVRRAGKEVIVEIRAGQKALLCEEVLALCERVGETPLPPYIHRVKGERMRPLDRERYQTVYARETGAVAAPTAGLHFTPGIIDGVLRAGATVIHVTLHVGLGTFQPLAEESFAQATLHEESVEVTLEAGREILQARAEGRRVIAVGTTAVRVVESFIARGSPGRWRTDLFIRPGYAFRGVDALLTNFHLPRSSLLVLVSAFTGRELVLEAYRDAIRQRYRFYSYGDAMLIL